MNEFIDVLCDVIKTYNFKKHMSESELFNFNKWLNQYEIKSYSKKKDIITKCKEDLHFAASIFSLFLFGVGKPKTKLNKNYVGIYEYGDEYYIVFKFGNNYYKLEWTKNGFIFDKVNYDKINRYITKL